MTSAEAPGRAWQWRYRWSIALYHGPGPLDLRPLKPRSRPILTPRSVTDCRAAAVADPFVLRRDGQFYMFFEVLNTTSGRGEIAFATSPDGYGWTYRRIVLSEPFHLSYPQIFMWRGAVYMIPETRQAGAVRLYRADAFPGGWSLVATLLEGPYADATLHHDGELYWLFSQYGLDELRLHFAESPAGPWHEHPKSPLWPGNRRRTRPGGRLVRHDGSLLRFAQDGWPNYGSALRAFRVERLDTGGFEEVELPQSPILRASREGWNALAMHHLEIISDDGAGVLAAVDGATIGPVPPS